MDDAQLRRLFELQQGAPSAPSPVAVQEWGTGFLELLFHQLGRERSARFEEYRRRWDANRAALIEILEPVRSQLAMDPSRLAEDFYGYVPELHEALLEDAHAIYRGDPAAVDDDEVIRTYPGFLAIATYRIAHFFHGQRAPVIPRVLTEFARSRTGIDIHPAATIGRRICIDHGTGIVVGETTEIGNDVKLYQGVTLGALSVNKDMARTKRHPTVEDDVVIYANTTILGGDTVVGRGSIIGGNVWLLQSVPPNSRIYYTPGILEKR
jgi:serine O-acetyltransferase